MPGDVFGERAILVPDGFLVPGHSNGGLYVLRMDEADATVVKDQVALASGKRGYFYHKGEWIDLNGDGRKDLLTARSNAKAGGGELLWLEHPSEGLDGEWTEHVIGPFADVMFTTDYDPAFSHEILVYAAHFFDEELVMTRLSTKDGTIQGSRVIDDTEIRSAYNV